MSGLIALLDDVAAIAKVAAASVDDIVSQAARSGVKIAGTVIDDAAKAGAKAAGAVIDDAAVTPRYVHGFDASRELPIIWRIAKGSLKNKLLYLLPAALALSFFAPWAIAPLLMIGGAYLCYEGAEKVLHVLLPAEGHETDHVSAASGDPAHLEEEKAAGAIKTDFILSAEIMTIALASIPAGNFWMQAATLAVIGIGITVLVYGSVALIVKADDVGLHMAEKGWLSLTRKVGFWIVKAMPFLLLLLSTVGTAAMLWVGGAIIIHGLEEMGWNRLGHWVADLSTLAGQAVPAMEGVIAWLASATMSGIFGLLVGFALIPVGKYLVTPLWLAITRKKA